MKPLIPLLWSANRPSSPTSSRWNFATAMKYSKTLVLASLSYGFCLSLSAHDGHEHADTSLTPPSQTSPRLGVQNHHYQVVAVAHADELLVYVDAYADNRPVSDLPLQVSHGDWQQSAQAIAPGTYRLATQHFAAAGHYPLQFQLNSHTRFSAELVIPASTNTALATAQPAQFGPLLQQYWPHLSLGSLLLLWLGRSTRRRS